MSLLFNLLRGRWAVNICLSLSVSQVETQSPRDWNPLWEHRAQWFCLSWLHGGSTEQQLERKLNSLDCDSSFGSKAVYTECAPKRQDVGENVSDGEVQITHTWSWSQDSEKLIFLISCLDRISAFPCSVLHITYFLYHSWTFLFSQTTTCSQRFETWAIAERCRAAVHMPHCAVQRVKVGRGSKKSGFKVWPDLRLTEFWAFIH